MAFTILTNTYYVIIMYIMDDNSIKTNTQGGIKMRKFKKLLSCAAATALAATSLLGSTTLSASAADLITNGGPYEGDAFYIATYLRDEYFQQSAFEITFKYDAVGTPSAPQVGEEDLGYGDTFEFLVFDSSWGGWNRTTVGPNGYDVTSGMIETPVAGEEYTITIPISIIESKLSTGEAPYGINLQTGAQLGTSVVSIVSLKYVSCGEYIQQPFTITGNWQKGVTESNKLTVDPATAATVYSNEYNIQVSAIDLSAWTNPTIDVTVTYDKESVDAEGNYAQAEILLPTGIYEDNVIEIYEPADPNYVDLDAGTYTFTTEIPNSTYKFEAAYDMCTVTEIKVYDNNEGIVSDTVTNKTVDEIAADMGPVWDLGNSLEASDGKGNVNEKAWGNPKTTMKLLQAVKKAGFNGVRIPISYLNAIDGNNQVDDAYMARITQVVNYAYNLGMYVVINIHDDGDPATPGSWINISATGDAFEAVKNKFAAVWADIANNFKGYDQRLIFQAANELVNQYLNWSVGPTQTEIENINALNAAFVNAVRNTAGGTNNAERALIIVCYRGESAFLNSNFVKPDDDMLMISFDYWSPNSFTFCSNEGGYDSETTWSVEYDSATTYGSKAYMEAQFAAISEFAGNLGMPVFLGEYGAANKNNTAQRANYFYWLNYIAADYGIVTAYWDNGVTGFGGTGLFDRVNNTITDTGSTLVEFIKAGYNQFVEPKLS